MTSYTNLWVGISKYTTEYVCVTRVTSSYRVANSMVEAILSRYNNLCTNCKLICKQKIIVKKCSLIKISHNKFGISIVDKQKYPILGKLTIRI